MRKLFIITVLFIITTTSFSQDVRPRLSYSSVHLVGVASGAQRDAPLIQTINGVSIKSWTAGVGIGIDGYSVRTIPLFLDVRKNLGKKDNVPFAYVDGGIHFPWLNFIQREAEFFPDFDQPSWYYDAGIGWKIPIGIKTGFLLSAGYTVKQLKGEQTRYNWVGGRSIESKETFLNTYRRLSIKMGVQL